MLMVYIPLSVNVLLFNGLTFLRVICNSWKLNVQIKMKKKKYIRDFSFTLYINMKKVTLIK